MGLKDLDKRIKKDKEEDRGVIRRQCGTERYESEVTSERAEDRKQ